MSDLSEFHELTEVEELRRANAELQRKLRRAKAKTEDLVEAAYRGAFDSMLSLGPVAPVPAPKPDRRRSRKSEVALWHLTDWQGAKTTQTYNSEVMRERIIRFCIKAEKLTEIQRADHPVKGCVILFGGDMGEGLFNFPSQPFQIDATIFGQLHRVSRLEVDLVRRALAIYEWVEVIDEFGNHGRIGSKRAAVPPDDNFDRMIHETARGLLTIPELNKSPEGWKLVPRLKWDLREPHDIQHVEIGNYRALLVHGDEIGRHGYASRNTFVQAVNRWRSGAHKGDAWEAGLAAHEFRDVYVGHYHNHGEDSLANGEGAVYWTGSPESDNRYASDGLAASALPSQRLHFIDPEAGRVTCQYKVHLQED